MTDDPRTGAEQKRDRRREARRVRQSSERRARIVRAAIISAVSLLVIGGIIVGLFFGIRALDPGTSPNRVQLEDEGRQHVSEGTEPQHANIPPASGEHWPTTIVYGIYDEPVPPARWVHNLEHGAVVLLYRCDADCDQVRGQIETVHAGLRDGAFGERKFVATPFEPLDSKFMLVAWGWQEPLDVFDAERVERFYSDFLDRGPERAP